MELSKKSFTAKLYSWFYDADLNYYYHQPKSLCNYFWAIIWMYIFLIVTLPLQIPGFLINSYFGHKRESSSLAGICFYVVNFIVGSIILGIISIFKPFDKNTILEGISNFGIATSVIIISSIILFLIIKYFTERSSSTTIVGEYIKAKKNKYCPKIDWKD